MPAPRTAPRTAPRITFGRQEGSSGEDKEIPIYLDGNMIGYLTICKEICFDPAKRLVFTGVRAVLWEVEEEPFFSADDHDRDPRRTVAAAKAWVKAKLAPTAP